jgi:hypothetical protein
MVRAAGHNPDCTSILRAALGFRPDLGLDYAQDFSRPILTNPNHWPQTKGPVFLSLKAVSRGVARKKKKSDWKWIAETMCVSPDQIRGWIKSGNLPWDENWKRADLNRWLEEKTVYAVWPKRPRPPRPKKLKRGGFKGSKPGTLYYVRVDRTDEAPLYKIGITNRTVKRRYCANDFERLTVVWQQRFQNGSEAYRREQEIIQKNSDALYRGKPVLLSNGDSELFESDVCPRKLNDVK